MKEQWENMSEKKVPRDAFFKKVSGILKHIGAGATERFILELKTEKKIVKHALMHREASVERCDCHFCKGGPKVAFKANGELMGLAPKAHEKEMGVISNKDSFFPTTRGQ